MKTLIKILCLSVLWFSCESDVQGCTNSSACNYNTNATNNDGSCIYAEPGYDCDNNCLVEIDCNGDCAGTAELDECGICNGETIEQCGTCEYIYLWDECYNIEGTTELDLNYSQLEGEIPSEIGDLINLERLYLDNNQLTGEIPPEIGDLINLERLYLDNNQLTGAIPSEICNISDQNLTFYNNKFCPYYPGCLEPNAIGFQDISECEEIYPCVETIEVPIIDKCYSIESTTYLDLSGLNITEFPMGIFDLINLEHLDLGYNQINGKIPSEIGNLINLERLYLHRNNLIGPIPFEIGNLINLKSLSLGYNELSHQIPSSSTYLTNLEYLNLSYNQLRGEIPSEIGDLINLEDLYLGNNQLTGEIPPEIGNLTNLRDLNLSYNQLSGLIPEEICNLNLTPILKTNELCPPYPYCINEMDTYSQNTSNCP